MMRPLENRSEGGGEGGMDRRFARAFVGPLARLERVQTNQLPSFPPRTFPAAEEALPQAVATVASGQGPMPRRGVRTFARTRTQLPVPAPPPSPPSPGQALMTNNPEMTNSQKTKRPNNTYNTIQMDEETARGYASSVFKVISEAHETLVCI